MKKFVLILLKLYKKYLAPINFGVKTCRFEPSCSTYTYESVEKYGIIRGLGKGFYRFLRCNPFNKGGYDPVE